MDQERYFPERIQRGVVRSHLISITALAVVAGLNWRKVVNERRMRPRALSWHLHKTKRQRNAERALAMTLHAYDLAKESRGVNLRPLRTTSGGR